MRNFIVWGCELHQHTNSYVYAAFYKAAKALGFNSFWFTPQTNTSGFDFSDSLFITEGQHCTNIPIRDDCTYVLHNCSDPALRSAKKKIMLQTYTYDADRKWGAIPLSGFPGTYILPNGEAIWQPWATDLLPNEINLEWAEIKRANEIHWVGTFGGGQFGNENEINPFKEIASKHGIAWYTHPPGSTSFENNRALIQKSFIAPTITGCWQTEVGYIPCRIFKNSSYGHLMVTNNSASFELLERLGVFSLDTRELFNLAKQKNQDKQMIKKSMLLIKEKHTFINRIKAILSIIKQS